MKRKPFTRILSLLLAVATMASLFTLPASAASLGGSGSVTIQQAGFGSYLSKSSGGTIGGGYWKYTSNDGLTGAAYCVNWGLKGVSPSKSLTIQEYNRNPQTMGAFANGYPNRTLAQFKELHADDVRGIASLTEDEYKYATQVAVWASCGQLAVPGTSFTAGRASLVAPTADARQIRVYDSVKAILSLASGWSKYLHTGLYLRAEEDRDVRGVEILNEYGLEGAAADNEDGIKKETIGGKEYYTRTMYVASATSTWIDGRTTKVYSTDAPQGTIFVAENNSPLETVQENGATCYKVDTSRQRSTNLNANGSEYYGAFKVCIPVDAAADEGSFLLQFDDPLELVCGYWESEITGYDHSGEMGHMLWEIRDRELFEKDQPAPEEVPPRPKMQLSEKEHRLVLIAGQASNILHGVGQHQQAGEVFQRVMAATDRKSALDVIEKYVDVEIIPAIKINKAAKRRKPQNER